MRDHEKVSRKFGGLHVNFKHISNGSWGKLGVIYLFLTHWFELRQYLIAQLAAWCTQFFSFGEEFRQHCLNLLFSIIKQTWLVHNRTWQCMCQSIGWCSIVCCISFSKLCFLIVFWQRSYENITFVHFSFRLASLALQTENIRQKIL